MVTVRRACIAALLAGFTSGAAAQATTATVKSVAVLPLKPKGKATHDLTEVLDDVIITALQNDAKDMRVVGKADIDAMLGLEKMKDAVGCDQAACAADVAGALGVESIMVGSVGTLGTKYVLSLNWVSQRTGQAFRRYTASMGSDQDTFDDAVRAAVAELMGRAPGAPIPAAMQSSMPDPGPEPASEGKIGLRVAEVPADMAEAVGGQGFALVKKVDGPAEAAGLRIGDIVTAVNDENVPSARWFADTLRRFRAAEVVRLRVTRPGVPGVLLFDVRKP